MRRVLPSILVVATAACADAPVHDHGDHAGDDPSALFEQAYVAKDDDKADTAGCNGVRVPDRGGFGGRVALTFDDGPNPETTPDVIDTLRRHGVPATFFINGSRVADDETRALAAEIAADPLFLLGNHTWSHPNMARLDAERVAFQIDGTTEVIAAAGAEPRWFRFPFGSSTCATAEAVRERGYVIAGWHVDSADWCFSTHGGHCPRSTFRHVPDALRDDMKAFVLEQVRAYDGGVVLFHDIHRYTADQLEAIIVALAEEGYTFTRLDDAETFPLLNGRPEAPAADEPFVGDACAEDADCDFEVWGVRGFCHAAGFCTMPCAGYCPDKEGHVTTFCVADTGIEPPTGICASLATHENGHCADLPGTIDVSVERFIGDSNAPPASAEACVPAPPQP